MAAEEPDDRWTITFRALSAFGPGAVCALLEDAKFDQEALKRRAPRQLCSRGDTLLTRAARLGNMAAAKQLLRLLLAELLALAAVLRPVRALALGAAVLGGGAVLAHEEISAVKGAAF